MKPLKRHSALLCLAFHSERNKIQIANSGAIPVLLEIIQCQKESLIDLAAAALLVLSSCSANKLAIAASGAILNLVGSLNSQLAEERGFQNLSMQAKLDIISTFHNLSTYPQIIPSIVSSGMVKAILQLMYEFGKQSEMIEKARALLEKMVSSSEIAEKEVAETASLVIHFLVEAIKEGVCLTSGTYRASTFSLCFE
ncbi:U-box domain-containing protein 6 isoform X2 [Coffea arabica]|uniref:U-box domain-containing protein 6 isoform X2 n=1 Tax=Coffea arabica TaxID=13443 RepID=A0A6P6SHH3_COFAR|nr:vacuolar protein 8-like isoform X2 [Coffea arabica]